MPLAFTTHVSRVPRLRLHAVREAVPAWQRLRQEGAQLAAALALVWTTLFADARRQVVTPALREALARSSLLEAEPLIMRAWAEAVDVPARQALLVLFREAMQRSAGVVLSDTTAVLRPSTALHADDDAPEAGIVLATYVGTQIQGIQQTTRRAVRAVLRAGFTAGHGVVRMAQTVRVLFGLTPRQVMSVETFQQRATVTQAAVTAVAALAVARRVEVIAQTQATATVQMGAHALWRQADRQGLWDAGQVRRVWTVAFDERACPVCRAIPGLNRGGVGLYAPFIMPGGTILHPPAHAACRCAVQLRRVSGLAGM